MIARLPDIYAWYMSREFESSYEDNEADAKGEVAFGTEKLRSITWITGNRDKLAVMGKWRKGHTRPCVIASSFTAENQWYV